MGGQVFNPIGMGGQVFNSRLRRNWPAATMTGRERVTCASLRKENDSLK